MSELEFKYNYKKIVLYIFITIILTILFTYLFLEANELVLRTPKGGKYSWVGHIFYQNEKLLSNLVGNDRYQEIQTREDKKRR